MCATRSVKIDKALTFEKQLPKQHYIWAPVGPRWAPIKPKLGPTGAQLRMLLGWMQGRIQDFGKGGGGGLRITVNYYYQALSRATFSPLFMKFEGPPKGGVGVGVGGGGGGWVGGGGVGPPPGSAPGMPLHYIKGEWMVGDFCQDS